MIYTFVDYNWYQQFFKELKALIVKNEKSKSIIEKKKSIILLITLSLANKYKEKEYYKNCSFAHHV